MRRAMLTALLAVAAAAFALIGRDPPADASGSADLPTVEPDAEEVQVAEEDPWAGDPLSAFGEDEGQEAAPEETTDGGAPAAAAFPESGDAQPTPSVAEGPEPVPAVPTPAEGQPDAQSSTQPDARIAELDAEPEPAEPDAEPEAVATDSEPEPVATEPEPEPVATDPEPEPAEPEPEPEPVAEEPTPSPTEQPVEEPAVPPAPEEDPATTAEPAPEAAETPVEETGPPPAPEITAPDLTPPPPNTGVEPGTMAFGVVVGRHGSFGAARSQAMSLRSDNSGVMFNVVPVDEGEVVYRVVAGPAATRADAEQIQSSLGDVAFGTAATVRATQWTYLLGVFGDYAEAITTVTGVQSAGLPAYLVEIPVGEDRVVYRAYSGAFATEAEAAALGTLLEEAGFGPTRLVERVGRPMR